MEERLCDYCGLPFVPKSNHQRYCKRKHYQVCPVCGKQVEVTNNEKLKNPPVACSYPCRQIKMRATSLAKYGIATPGNNPKAREKAAATMKEKYGGFSLQSKSLSKRIKQTMIDRYGVENPSQSDMLNEKREATCIDRYGATTYLSSKEGKSRIADIMNEKYGATYPAQNPEILAKIQQTCLDRYGTVAYVASEQCKQITQQHMLERYGVKHYSQSEEFKLKLRQYSIENYGVPNPSQSQQVKDKIAQTMISRYGRRGTLSIPQFREKVIKTSLERYGVPYHIMLKESRNASGAVSKLNTEVLEVLKTIDKDSFTEYRIKNRSYDICMPNYNTLVEINPTYTHNLLGNHWGKGLSYGYHMHKNKLAIESGYNIRTIYDWQTVEECIDNISTGQQMMSCLEIRTLREQLCDNFIGTEHEPKGAKIVCLGVVNNTSILGAAKLALINNTWEVKGYRISSQVCRGQVLVALTNFIYSLIEDEELKCTIPLNKVYVEDAELIEITSKEYSLSEVVLSKGCKTQQSTENDEELIRQGWLPVETAGTLNLTLKIRGQFVYES